jgi:hypothetical protein
MKPKDLLRKYFMFLPAILLVTSITACKKLCKDDELDNSNNVLLQPQNSFSCLLNGVEYVPKGGGFHLAYEPVHYSKSTGSFYLYTLNKKDFEEYIYIYI